jgi:hypothetical protein
VPLPAQKLLKWCLEKDRKQRLQAIGDARRVLDEAPAQVAAPPRSRFGAAGWMAAAIFALALGLLSWFHLREPPTARQRVRFEVAPPAGIVLDMKLSRDGRFLAFSTTDLNGTQSKLWVRALDGLNTTFVATIEETAGLFWSPDSDYLGFYSRRKLYKMARTGGPAIAICDTPDDSFAGADWGIDGTILFSSGGTLKQGPALYRVSSTGGSPGKVEGGNAAVGPVWLTTETFLYSSPDGIFESSVKAAKPSRLLPDTSTAVFVPPARSGLPGHVLFRRGQTLMALPINAGRAAGEAFPLLRT